MKSENFSKGLYKIEIPELGAPFRGKVRDNWIVQKGKSKFRLMITTDRQSVLAKTVCTIPGKGQISNLISAYWFAMTKDIVQNQVITVPHPNIIIARQAQAVIPIEVVLRRYMAKSSSPTSVYFNYIKKGRRNIYGIDFPEGLLPNQEFPMGTILTPTTKAPDGHDKEISNEEAEQITDSKFGRGTWKTICQAAHRIFERARVHCLERGLILVDTKFEFGTDEKGNIMVIDEILTPECSRFWILNEYKEDSKNDKVLEFDKDILTRWLVEKQWTDGEAPTIDDPIISKMLKAYSQPYTMITGNNLPKPVSDETLMGKIAFQTLTDFLQGD